MSQPKPNTFLSIGWSLVELDEEREQVGIGKKNLSAMTHSFLTRPVRRTEMYFNVDENVNVRFHECGVAPVNPFYSGDWDKREGQGIMLDPDVRVSILFQVITVERRRCFETVEHLILIKYLCMQLATWLFNIQ